MGSTLEALHRLQVVETQLADLRGRIAAKWRLVRAHEKKAAMVDAELAIQKKEIQTRQMEVDRFDLDIKSRDAEVAKQRAALNAAKTNKEYSAILTQLNTVKADMGKLEERGMELIGQLDEIKKHAADAADRRAAEQKRIDELKAEAEAYESQCGSRLADLTAKRADAAAAVPAAALSLFERVAARNEGKALAMVIRTHPKREEFACEGCNMSITLQQVNTLMSRDEPVICNNCGHILFLEAAATMR